MSLQCLQQGRFHHFHYLVDTESKNGWGKMGLVEVIRPNPLTQTGCQGLWPHVKYCFCYIQVQFPLKQLVCLVFCTFLCREWFHLLCIHLLAETVMKSLLSSSFSSLSTSHFFNFFFVYHIHQSSNQLGGSLLSSPQFFSVLLELKKRMKCSRCSLTSIKRNNGSPQAVQDSPGLVTVRALYSLELAVPQGPS